MWWSLNFNCPLLHGLVSIHIGYELQYLFLLIYCGYCQLFMGAKMSDKVCIHGITKVYCAYCRADEGDEHSRNMIKAFTSKTIKRVAKPVADRITIVRPVTL